MRVRSWLALVGLLLTAAACTGVDTEGPAASFPLPQAERAELMARALAQVCDEACANRKVYLHDRIADVRPVVFADPIPFEIQVEIRRHVTGITFLALDDLEDLFDDRGRVDEGDGVLLTLGPVSARSPSMVAVDVGVSTSQHDFAAWTVYFRWDGREWGVTDLEEAAITPTVL